MRVNLQVMLSKISETKILEKISILTQKVIRLLYEYEGYYLRIENSSNKQMNLIKNIFIAFKNSHL